MLTLRDREAHSGSPITRRPYSTELPDTYPKGRRCVEPGCITVLNRYNGGPWCLIHAQRHEAELLQAERDAIIKGGSTVRARELVAA